MQGLFAEAGEEALDQAVEFFFGLFFFAGDEGELRFAEALGAGDVERDAGEADIGLHVFEGATEELEEGFDVARGAGERDGFVEGGCVSAAEGGVQLAGAAAATGELLGDVAEEVA